MHDLHPSACLDAAVMRFAELAGGAQGSAVAALLAVRVLHHLPQHSRGAAAATQESMDSLRHHRCECMWLGGLAATPAIHRGEAGQHMLTTAVLQDAATFFAT